MAVGRAGERGNLIAGSIGYGGCVAERVGGHQVKTEVEHLGDLRRKSIILTMDALFIVQIIAVHLATTHIGDVLATIMGSRFGFARKLDGAIHIIAQCAGIHFIKLESINALNRGLHIARQREIKGKGGFPAGRHLQVFRQNRGAGGRGKFLTLERIAGIHTVDDVRTVWTEIHHRIACVIVGNVLVL